jgi:hypothetical protein
MNVPQLYEAYYENRTPNLRPDEFQYLLAITPALLIAKADGEIQEAEQQFLDRAASDLAEGLADEGTETSTDLTDVKNAFQNELSHLVHHLEHWEQPFLNCLKEFLPLAVGMDGLIKDMMNETAQAHPSPEHLEQKKMAEICQILGI